MICIMHKKATYRLVPRHRRWERQTYTHALNTTHPHTHTWHLLTPSQVKLQLNQQELAEEVEYLQRQKPHPIAAQFYNPRRSSLEPNIFFEPTLSLLLQWCRAVCAIYGVPVSKQCNRGVAHSLLGMEAGILVIGHQMSRNGF